MLAGVGAGVAGSFVACPTELIKCRLQAQSGPRPLSTTPSAPLSTHTTPVRYSGPLAVARHVLAAEGGAVGLFRGLTPTLLREVPGNAAMFGTYAAVKAGMASAAGLASVDALPKPALLVAGGVAGAAFWLSCYPMDVVKSKIQTDSPATGLYRGTLDCIRKVGLMIIDSKTHCLNHQTYAAEGVAGFFRGFGPAMARSVPANAAAFATYELCVSALTAAPMDAPVPVVVTNSHL